MTELEPLEDAHAAARAVVLALVGVAAAALFVVGIVLAGLDAAGTAAAILLAAAALTWHLVQLVREERARRRAEVPR